MSGRYRRGSLPLPSSIITIVMVVFFAFAAVLFGMFFQNISGSASVKSQNAYLNTVYFEEVLGAECMTEGLNVFNLTVVENGVELIDCVTTSGPMDIKFTVQDGGPSQYSYTIFPGDPIDVSIPRDDFTSFSGRYSSAVFPAAYLSDDGRMYSGEVRIWAYESEFQGDCRQIGGVCQDAQTPCADVIEGASCGSETQICCAVSVGSP